MHDSDIIRIIPREINYIKFLIVLTNVLILYSFQQLKILSETMSSDIRVSTFLNVFLTIVILVLFITRKPFEVVDLRPSKNIDLK